MQSRFKQILRVSKVYVVQNNYSMDTHALPDIHVLSPQACVPGASGMHVRQNICANA